MESTIFFPPFRLDLGRECLLHEQEAIALKPKSFAVLRYLAEHSEQLVTKDQLLDALWSDVHVGDAVLKTCMREIRRALGDDAKAPRFIETVHRRGYRFIAEINHPSTRPFPNGRPQGGLEDSLPPARFVGRESELTQLHAWLEKAGRGERQLIFVTGEAGIGKTTLVETFLEQLATSGTVWLGHGQCVEHYGQGEAYLPLLEAFGRLGRGPGGERLVEILSRYAPTWLVQMPALLEAGELHPLQQKIVGATQGRMLREMAEALEALTAERPFVLCVEDLHWSDYSSLELLAYLARRLGPSRLLFVGTYRPVDVILREHPLKDLKQDLLLHGYCEELRVEFLSQAAVGQYLDQRFVGSLFADRLAPEIHRRTEGNPLFMVNVIDDLIRQEVIVQHAEGWAAGEVADIQLPLGIQRFIEQRIEQTDPDVQLLLEAASIAGMDFSATTIASVLGEAVETVERQCETLVRREQFLGRSTQPQAANNTVSADYRFIHALYQETFYNHVSTSRRARLHQRMGENLEQAFSAQTGQIAVELALHFEQGRDYPKAMQYLWQAGETATRRYAPQEAVRHYTKSLELLALTPDTPERAQHELMLLITVGAPMIVAKSAIAPEVEQTYARARELCQQMDEAPQLFPALAGLYRFHVIRGEHAVAQELALQLLHLAESVQDPTFFISADVALGYVLFLQGKFREAQEHLERSRALYDPVQHGFLAFMYGDDPGIMSSAFLAWTLWFRGYADQALTRSQEALRLATELAHPHVLSSIHGLTAQLYRFRREAKQSLEQADVSVTLSTEQGGDIWIAIGTMFRGWALTEKGQGKEGIAQMQQGLAAYQAIGAAAELPHYLSLLAEAYGKIGQPEEGLAVLEEVFVAVEASGERFFEAELYRLKGELLLNAEGRMMNAERKGKTGKSRSRESVSLPHSAEAQACFLKALQIAREQDAKSLELRAAMSLARLWHEQGKSEAARRLLAEIYDWFSEGFETQDLQDAKALLVRLS